MKHTDKYTFVFKPSVMKPMWADYGGYSRPGLKRHGHKWLDAERRHLYAGFAIEGKPMAYLVHRHERGDSGIAAQLNRIMEDAALEARLIQQLHQHGEIMYAKINPAQQVTLQPGEQLSVRAAPLPDQSQIGDRYEASRANGAASVAEQGTGERVARLNPAHGALYGSAAQGYRPHADIMFAYAEGKDIQFQYKETLQWLPYDQDAYPPLGHSEFKWRVKPVQQVDRVVCTWWAGPGESGANFRWPGRGTAEELKANLELTFEAGELVKARVLK